MTRKQYIKKGQQLILAIYKDIQSDFPENHKVGKALKQFKENAKNVPKTFGSYEEAWNCEPMRFARRHYLKEDI